MQGLDVASSLTADVPGSLTIGGKKGQSATHAPRRTPCDRSHHVQVVDEGLGPVRLRWQVVCRTLRFLVHPEDQKGVGDHERSHLRGATEVGVIEAAHLPRAEGTRGDRFHEPQAVRRVGARQGHQVLHRRVRDEAAFLHSVLHERRQVTHQTQPARDPTHAAVEAPRQLLHRKGVVLVQRTKQPPLLERGVGRLAVKKLTKDQRLGFAHLPTDGADRIAVQLSQAPDPFVTIDHDVLAGDTAGALPAVSSARRWSSRHSCMYSGFRRRHQACVRARRARWHAAEEHACWRALSDGQAQTIDGRYSRDAS